MGCPTSGRETKSLSINTGPVSLLIRDGGNEHLPSLGHAPHALACDPHCSHVWHTIGTHGTHHRCVFGVIMDTPPRICTPSTIWPAARSFHPLLPPLLEAPTAPPIHRHSNSRPDRAGVTPTRRTHRTDSHARMHSTHAHQQPHTNTNIHTDIHARTHTHTNTNTHSHTHTHTRKPIHTHPSKMILLQSRCPVLTRSPRLRVYTVCEISTRATCHRKRPRASRFWLRLDSHKSRSVTQFSSPRVPCPRPNPCPPRPPTGPARPPNPVLANSFGAIIYGGCTVSRRVV